MQKFGHADRAPAGPVSAWVPPARVVGQAILAEGCGSSGSSGLDNMPVTGNTGGVTQGTAKVVVVVGEAAGRQEVVRLAGSAKMRGLCLL